MGYENTLSDTLKISILSRVYENSTGMLKVPADIVRKVRKETDTKDTAWMIRTKVQNFVNLYV